MEEGPKEKKYARPAEPFSSDPVTAWSQLQKMRPRLVYYFQSQNVLSSHDEALADRTIDIVWGRHSSGTLKIRDRKAYTYMVAKSLLIGYREKGLRSEIQPKESGELPEIQSPGFSEGIEEKIDNQKKWACVAECGQKLIDKKLFSEEIVKAFFKYKLIEGHDREERDRIAESLNMSRLVFEQVIQNVKKELIKCTSECMNRPRKK
jgi:hypothetical protein